MGSSHTKEKSRNASEKVVEGLKEKVRVLQGEINEIMCMREREREVYERELMVFAFKQAEWKRERKGLKEEVKKVRKLLEEKKLEKSNYYVYDNNNNNNNNIISDHQNKEDQNRRDETLEKWKQLYFAIKVELDDLIRRTRQEERLCWKIEEEDVLLELKQEVTVKEERIEFLQAKLVAMEHQELRREREIDILRQSLRIMSHKRRSTKNHQHTSN